MIGIVMAGGTGTRFWPLSRKSNPKQCLKIIDKKKAMIEQTIDRFKPFLSDKQIFISTGDIVEKPLRRILSDKYEFIIEPLKRNTAAAIALCTFLVEQKTGNEDEVLAFVGADYHIKEKEIFLKTLKEAESMAKNGYIVTIGIKPRFPSTGYGYIERGEIISSKESNIHSFKVENFKEKPDKETAEEYISTGKYYWNSGMFVASIRTLKTVFKQHSAIHYNLLTEAQQNGFTPDSIHQAFVKMPSISFDYAIMEKTTQAAVIEGSFYWDDVGSWESVKSLVKSTDSAGNTVVGDKILLIDSKDSLIINDNVDTPLIAVLGSESFVIIQTADAILICPKNRSQDVKKVVDLLESRNMDSYL
jgi:mannose-1-phosphate guanylyltransferase/mannose-6-phosphate isomerase